MTSAELRAASKLGGPADFRIEQVREAIAGRAFGPVRQAGAPVRLIHDAVSRGAYLAVRSAASAAGALSGEFAPLLGRHGQPVEFCPGREPGAGRPEGDRR